MNVLLVHGLGRTPLSMFGLASALRKAGHRTTFFGYCPALESLPRILRRLETKLRSLGSQPVGLIGHSLGGLLLRMALERQPERRVAHLVMLGTPNQPPRAARMAWRLAPFRFWTRDCGQLLADETLHPRSSLLSVPYTIVAGTAGPSGRLSPFGTELNDGIVAYSEACLSPQDAPELVFSLHSFLMDNPQVRRIVLDKLSNGISTMSG